MIFLIGTFPVLSISPERLKRLISFSVLEESSPTRVLSDEFHLR